MGTAALVAFGTPIAAAQDDSETVTVTAQRRSQNLQKVPAAVTALTSALRDQTGIVSAQQQLNFTPGVTYNPSADRVTVRGIGRLSTQLGTDPGVAVYQDGFYIGSVAGIGGSTLGTERVEVLRGPQGTLYGRNSIGGAVNTISRRPSEDFAFDARTSMNNYGGFTVEGRASGALFEGVSGSLRLGAVSQDEGYYKNVSNGVDEGGPEESWYLNAQLRYESEDFDAWVSYTTLKSDTRPRSSTGITAYGVPNRGTGVPYVFYGLPADGNPGVEDHRAFRTDRSSQASYDDYHQVIGDAVWHGDGFDVKYIGGYRTYDYKVALDGNATDNTDFSFPLDCGLLRGVDGDTDNNLYTPPDINILQDCDLTTPGVQTSADLGVTKIIHNDATQEATDVRTEYSHEINITSTGDGPLQYIVGAYFFHGDQRQDFTINAIDEAGNRVVNSAPRDEQGVIIPGLIGASPTLNTDPNTSLIYRFRADLETKSTAVFGQLDYEFSDEFKATVGLRWSKDEKTGHEENIYVYWLTAGLPISSTPYAVVDTIRLNEAQAARYGLPVGTVVKNMPVVPLPGLPAVLPLAPPYTNFNVVGASCPQPGSASLPDGVPDFYRLDPRYACPIGRDLEAEYDAVTGTAGLEWTPTDDRLVYVKYSRGYKSGGFANLGSALKNPFVDAETIDAYEAGWKEKVDDTFRFSTSAFYYQYHDQQSPVAEIQGPDNQRIAVSVLKNLPEVETYGAELEAQWEPVENLRLLLNYSYLHTEILEGCCYSDVADPGALQPGAKPVGAPNTNTALYYDAATDTVVSRTTIIDQAQTLVGNELAGSPKHKVALNATYTWALDEGELIGSVTWNWRDDSYQTLFNNPLHLIKGGDTTDIRVSWIDADSGVSIIGTVTNVFDDELASGFFTDSPARLSFQSLFLEPPRIATLEVRYSF